jgi:ADP-ribose pyrophosphatase
VIIHEGRAVIVQRGGPPRQGEWTVPGGMLEIGETLRGGVEREVLEETGLVVKAGDVLDILDSIHRDPYGRTQYHYVLVDFLCTWISGELRAGSDVAQARWITREEMESISLIGFTAQVIGKAFEKIQG